MMRGGVERRVTSSRPQETDSLSKENEEKLNTSYMAHTYSLTFRRSKQEDSRFKAGLGYLVRLFSKPKKEYQKLEREA